MNAGYFDKSFAKTGRTIITWAGTGSPSAPAATVEAEAIQSNGKIILAGEIPVRGVSTGIGKPRLIGDIGVVRLNANGSLDTSFGTGGRAYLAFASASVVLGTDLVSGVAIDAQGRIVIAGTGFRADGTSEIVTERLNPNGTIDKSYGLSGRSYANSTIPGSTGLAAEGLAIDGQGRIVVGAQVAMSNGQSEFGAIRLATNGNYDQSFGVNGQTHYLLAEVDVNQDRASSLALDSNGGILVGGFVYGSAGSFFGVVRFQENGNLDRSFHQAIVDNPFGARIYANKLAVKAGGIVLVGTTTGGSDTAFVAQQLQRNGDPDPNFGANGYSSAGYPLGGTLRNQLGGMALDASGRVVIAGGAYDGKKFRTVVIRLLPNGSFDNSFGIGGRSDLSYGKSYPKGDYANAIAVDAQGRIVVAGTVNKSFSVERING